MNPDHQALIDRALISDVVIRYATALDRRDWALLRSTLDDSVWIDYSSFDPGLDHEMPAGDWVSRVGELGGFTATQHLSTNHVHTLDGDRARCVSQMQAAHFLARPDGQAFCFLYGYYTNDLRRTPDGWKIVRCALTITASHGDNRVFEWAFGTARAARDALS